MSRIYKKHNEQKGILLICLVVPILSPIIELTIVRIGLDTYFADLINSFVLLISVVLLFLINPSIKKGQIFIVIYLILKAIQSIYNGFLIPDILVTLVSFMLVYAVFDVASDLKTSLLIKYLKVMVGFLFVAIIIVSEVNRILNGNVLSLLFQNLSIILLLSSLLWFKDFPTKKLNYWLYLFSGVTLYYVFVIFTAGKMHVNAIIQMKFAVLHAVIFVVFVTIFVFNKYFYQSLKRAERYDLLKWSLILSALIEYSGPFRPPIPV